MRSNIWIHVRNQLSLHFTDAPAKPAIYVYKHTHKFIQILRIFSSEKVGKKVTQNEKEK